MTLQAYSIKFTPFYVVYQQIVKTICRKILHLLSGLYCTNIVMELPHCRKTLAASWYVALRILIPQTSRSWSPTWIFQNILFCKCGLMMLESMWCCVVGWNISQIHKLTEHDILTMLANLAIHRCSKTTVYHNLLSTLTVKCMIIDLCWKEYFHSLSYMLHSQTNEFRHVLDSGQQSIITDKQV